MERRTFTYKTVGRCEIRADAYGLREGRPRPVVVYIHGGALIMGSRTGVPLSQIEALVDDGCVVVSIDYRLAPETKLPAIIEDVRDVFRWLRDEGPALLNAEPDRLVVMGGSAGGYLTLMAGFCVEPRPRALVSFYGYGDIVGPWYRRPDPYYCTLPQVPQAEAFAAVGHEPLTEGAGDRSRFYLYCRQHGLWPIEVAGYNPDGELGAFVPYCPERNVTRDYPPTLLLHGDRDTDVPYALSVSMAEALARAGAEHELITICGGGHGFDGAADEPAVQDALSRVRRFVREKLAIDLHRKL